MNKFNYRKTGVTIAAVGIMAGMTGLMSNCMGVLFSAILQDLSFGAGNLSVYYTIKSLISAATVGLTSNLVIHRKKRGAAGILCVVGAASVASMVFFTHLWQWYLSAVFAGVAAGPFFTVVPAVLNNWYKKNNGSVIGLVMAGSGITGAVFSPVISTLISHFGWRNAALSFGIMIFLIAALPSLVFFDIGSEGVADGQIRADYTANVQETQEEKTGVHGRHKECIAIDVMCMFVIVLPTVEVAFNFQIPTMTQAMGYSLTMGGLMTSTSMAGNVAGKFLLGYLSDRIRIYRAIRVISYAGIFSMILLLFAHANQILLLLAALTFGFLFSLANVGPALLMLDVYGEGKYVDKLNKIQAAGYCVSAFAESVYGYFYDWSGNYNLAFVSILTMAVITVLLTGKLQKIVMTRSFFME